MTRMRVSSVVLASLLLAAAALLTGCGPKGPLVLPDGDSAGTAVPSSSDDEEERDADDEQNATESGANGR